MTINAGIIERILTAGIYETISELESNRIYQGKIYLSNITSLMRKCLPESFKSCNNGLIYF